MAPGTAYSDAVRVSNLGEGSLTLDIYPADAATTPDGSFTAAPASEPALDAATWITTDVSEATVPPGESADIPFDIKIPPGATPGDHAAVVIASRLVEAVDENGARIAVDQRVGARVYLRISGPARPGLTVSDFKTDYGAPLYPFGDGRAKATFRVTNSGNITLAAKAALTALGPFKLKLGESGSLEYDSLLPGASVEGELEIEGVFPAFFVSFELSVEGTPLSEFEPMSVPPATAVAKVLAIPWLIAGVLAALIAALVWRRVRVRRSKRKRAAPKRIPRHARTPDGEPAPIADAVGAAPQSESRPPEASGADEPADPADGDGPATAKDAAS
jgi:hypothetical protein